MSDLLSLPLDLIEANPTNPRQHLGDIEELAASIRSVGVLQPVTVLPSPPLPHRLVSGHRRVAAAIRAGLTEIPVIVRDLDDAQVLPVALIENLHRQDLGAMDEADAFAHLRDVQGWPIRRIARAVAVSEALVYQKLQLLELPLDVQSQIRSGEVAWTAAYEQRDRKRKPRVRGEQPPLSTVKFKSGALFSFAAELRKQAASDTNPERAHIHEQVAAHFEQAGQLLEHAAKLRQPMACPECGESYKTHPISKRCS